MDASTVLSLLKGLDERIQDESKMRRAFELSSSTAFGRLEEGMTEACRRLKILNGGQEENTRGIAELRKDLAEHPLKCPLKPEVTSLAEEVAQNREERTAAIASIRADMASGREAAKAAQEERSRWHKLMHPGYILAFILAVLLIIGHSKELYTAIGKIW